MVDPQIYSVLSNPEVLSGLTGDRSSENTSSVSSARGQVTRQKRHWQWAYPQIEGVAPRARGGHTASLFGSSLIVFGGHYYGGKSSGYIYLNDTHVLDVNSNRWVRPRLYGTPPSPRYGHSAVLAGTRVVIFGGRGKSGHAFRDLHALEANTMTWYQGPESSNGPMGRMGHTADLIGSKMFVVCGWNKDQFFNDVNILDLSSMSWTRPQTSGASPLPRMGHVSVVIGNNILIQGGVNFKGNQRISDCYLNDVRVLDTETFVWSRLRVSGAPPKQCYWHSMDVSGADVLVFGGYGNFRKADEKQCEYFLVLDTDNMLWQPTKCTGAPPRPRHGHSSTTIGAHVLLFGGWENAKAMNDVIVIRDLSSVSNRN